jgi:uncharacterized protein YyaL (SSP411 family)
LFVGNKAPAAYRSPVISTWWGKAVGLAVVVTMVSCSMQPTEPQRRNIVSNATAVHEHTNRLAREKSPYLLQHQHNPVDWYAWGEDAFAKARAEDKPIFLSIGYSTCHWCHVMERESFENQELADYLNQHFVSIKVDREERPDVDRIYMTFVQAMTGQGGWPLNVFLTADLKPFYGGTYWPPEAKYGRPSFLQVLNQINKAWHDRRDQLTGSSTNMHEQLVKLTSREATNGASLGEDILKRSGEALKENYDPTYGGWGTQPKFPSPSHPAFLLRYGKRYKDQEAVDMVLHTCERMASGGIYDQIGGGFSRYSVDRKWLVPHFEKMLYDNAQLLNLYLDSFLVSGDEGYADVARDIIRYLLRDMTHPDGGFYSAEDADSEGKEGKFYTWTRGDLAKILTPEEFNVATKYFGVTQKGNFVDHSDPEPLPDQNVLSIADTNVPASDMPLLLSAKEKIFTTRSKRVRPHLDDKVLASWNGLMLGALARASVVLGEDSYRVAAEKNFKFLTEKLWDARTKTLYHRWRDGERDSVQLLEGYSYLLAGALELYQVTLEPRQLEFCVALADSMLEKFYDPAEGGFWQTPRDAAHLILRIKEDHDGAEPSGNSVAILGLLKLGAITEKKEFRDAAEKSLRLFADRMRQLPQGVPYMLMALDFSLEEPKRVVLAGDVRSETGKSLLRAVHGVYQPNKVVLSTSGLVEPFAKTLQPMDGKPTAYVCTGTACQPPTHDPMKVKESLK